jgi:hypothetical protein
VVGAGACGACRVCYESLEIKSVQLDTLGNVLALQALDAGHYDLASSIFSTTNSFFVSAAKDVSYVTALCDSLKLANTLYAIEFRAPCDLE